MRTSGRRLAAVVLLGRLALTVHLAQSHRACLQRTTHRGRGAEPRRRNLRQLTGHVLGEHPELVRHLAGDGEERAPGNCHGEALAREAERAADSPFTDREVRWVEAIAEVEAEVRLATE